MTKLEKVISGLECCMNTDCENCPYTEPTGTCTTLRILFGDTLELLKEREAQPAIIEGSDVIRVGRCPSCKTVLQPWGANYCHKCGQAVKWNG